MGPRRHGSPVGRAGRPARGGQGFTLLEVLLVLAVMALGAALTLPALVRPSGTELRTAAGSVVAGLRRAREAAVNTQRATTLTVNVADASFTVQGDGAERRLPGSVALSLFTARSEIEDEARGRIRFFPDGSSTGGRITLASGERRYHVDVDWLTGRVRVYSGEPRSAPPGGGRVGLGS